MGMPYLNFNVTGSIWILNLVGNTGTANSTPLEFRGRTSEARGITYDSTFKKKLHTTTLFFVQKVMLIHAVNTNTYAYMNRADVQEAIHANVTKHDHTWEPCSKYQHNCFRILFLTPKEDNTEQETDGVWPFHYIDEQLILDIFDPDIKVAVQGCAYVRQPEIKAAGSSYGNYFRVTTFGESGGGGVSCIIDGCPSKIPLSEANLQVDLDRRYYLGHHSSFLLHHPFSHGAYVNGVSSSWIDKIVSPKYTSSGKWVADCQKKKVVADYNWAVKNKKMEQRISACVKKIKKFIRQMYLTFLKTQNIRHMPFYGELRKNVQRHSIHLLWKNCILKLRSFSRYTCPILFGG
ncbi:chorismate synthase, chloroplastic [Artemisia annua]|uniref:chorismate synthase n=1 Tax=Artemisia annua TaxID=35608 RepID=A0A2U1NRC2_ARTAN|nr:chorismate synthase, chloroplastic [Artemisia annua]